MQAIILAAGMGNRLGHAHDGPKCLLDIDGRSLLERHLLALDELGVDRVTLCLGHRSSAIETALAGLGGTTPLLHYNPLYRYGSVVSLWCARQTLLSGDDVLLMDADVLYHPAILERLVHSPAANCFLLDRDYLPGDEPVKICLQDDTIVEFGKQIPAGLSYNRIGESVGFFKFDATGASRLGRIISAHVADDRRAWPHETAIREFALAGNIGIEDITGLPWIEIDFPEDIERARGDILSRIKHTS